MRKILARTSELQVMEQIWHSKQAEFVAIYGRRRIGKTFLIREYFHNKGIYFELTGMKDAKLNVQLENFTQALSKLFYGNIPLKPLQSWREAFKLLTEELQKHKNRKIIVFFDELPWLASSRSGFLQCLDYYWNTDWVRRKNLRLIV